MKDLVVVEKIAQWQWLKALVLDSVSSPITRRVYSMALDEFLAWFREEPRPGGFCKATVSAWRASLETRGLGSSSIIIRMSAIRKLASEAADNGLIAPELAAGIARVKSVKSTGIRVGNWLTLRPRIAPRSDEVPRVAARVHINFDIDQMSFNAENSRATSPVQSHPVDVVRRRTDCSPACAGLLDGKLLAGFVGLAAQIVADLQNDCVLPTCLIFRQIEAEHAWLVADRIERLLLLCRGLRLRVSLRAIRAKHHQAVLDIELVAVAQFVAGHIEASPHRIARTVSRNR